MTRLRYIIGAVADFAEIGIDPGVCRLSLDGTQMIIHQEYLSDDQMDAVIAGIGDGKPFFQRSNTNPELAAILGTTDWTPDGTSPDDIGTLSNLEDLLLEEMGVQP